MLAYPPFLSTYETTVGPFFRGFSRRVTFVPTVWVPKMFAKAAGRNPRRRQRTSSDDSVKPPKAKRQRSVLRQTDEPPSTSLDVGGGHVPAGPAAPSLSDDHDLFKEQAGQDSHLPIRSVKPSESPKNDFDGTVVLVSRPVYYCPRSYTTLYGN